MLNIYYLLEINTTNKGPFINDVITGGEGGSKPKDDK